MREWQCESGRQCERQRGGDRELEVHLYYGVYEGDGEEERSPLRRIDDVHEVLVEVLVGPRQSSPDTLRRVVREPNRYLHSREGLTLQLPRMTPPNLEVLYGALYNN